MKLFGREVSMWLSLVAATVAVLSSLWLGWDHEEQAYVNAAAVALAGVLTSVFVLRNSVLPAVVGLAEAVFALALGFGADVGAETQGAVIAFITIATGFFVRQNVDAPVPEGSLRSDSSSPLARTA